jgi:hypothetical protein
MFLIDMCPLSARGQVVLRPIDAPAARGPNLIENGGFEQPTDTLPAGWKTQLAGRPVVDTTCVHRGRASLRFVKNEAATVFWVSHNVELNQKQPAPLVISGWSKAERVTGKRGANYSVWVDLQYTDGTSLWGQKATFNVGTHDWQLAEFPFVVAKPVRRATVNVLFRGSATGTVWFDDVALQELAATGGGMFDGGSVSSTTEFQPLPRRATARVITSDGLVLGFTNGGELAEFTVDKKSFLGTAPGGFWVRDVAAAGPWMRITGRAWQDGKAVRLEGELPSASLRLIARLTPRPGTVDVSGTLQDTTGADRAVSLCFVLPLLRADRVWHDDIVRSTPAVTQREFSNARGWPAGARMSSYPLASITSAELGLTLAATMDCPRVCRFVYNTWFNVFYVGYDFGLAREPVQFPSRADFRFALYRHAPEWGFRAAVQGYYDRFPQCFVQRLKRGGIWMAFADIGKVEHNEDFGFAYDELGGDHQKYNDAHRIASFHYVEPMTYWLSMDSRYPRTYEGAMQALADNGASGKASLVRWAQATRRCAAFTREGQLDLSLENQSWCDGAVFTLNPDPQIAEDAACPKNKGHLSYNKAWADKHLVPTANNPGHGVYIDSMPNWGDVRNWRREHWRTVDAPLTFDGETREPVLLQLFSTWQFSRWVADDVHARGGVMHGNGGALWPYFSALLDVTGQETHRVLDDATMAMARTLLRNKPYSPLMNTRFDAMGPAVVEEYFNKSLLYGIFPSFFNGTYLKDGKWVSVHYFKEPKFYNRDRPMFRKYIPVLRRMFDASWQVIPYARTDPPTIRVERYGTSAGRDLLFALYNPTATEVYASLLVDAAPLGLKLRTGVAEALVTRRLLSYRPQGGKIETDLSLKPGKCEVVRLAP